MNILFLSRWFPFPHNNGSKLRVYNLLHGLSQHHVVTLLCFSNQPIENSEVAAIRSICSEVYIIPWREFNPSSLRAKLGFLSLSPRSIIDTFSSEMAGKIAQLLDTQQYDLIIASELSMAAYYPYFEDIPAIFEDLELGLSLDDSHCTDWKKYIRHALTSLKLRAYLALLLDAFRVVTVVSNQEKELVQRNFPNARNVLVIPNCVNIENYKDIHVESKPNTLVFTGSFRYHVNYEAMLWFVGEVFPLVLEKIPSTELIITGDHANLPLPLIKNVTLAGYVDDIKSLIASSTVALAPLWSGGGTRLKILEAMAVGTPVIATSKGAEGLEAIQGEHLFLADDPVHFAEAVVQLLQDIELRSNISINARQLVMEKYNWLSVMPAFLVLVKEVSRK